MSGTYNTVFLFKIDLNYMRMACSCASTQGHAGVVGLG